MLQWLKKAWRGFKRLPPGHRFQETYKRRQRSRRGGAKRVLFIGGGLLTIVAGIVSFPVPGVPSELIIVAGLAIFAQGSMRAARILDWIELHLRGPYLRLWKPLPRWAKVVIGALWMALLAAGGYGLHRLFFGK
ncbi:MAG TPA: PGPGW domain-containing protein [Pyrinomonadaceae bacterium]